MSFSAEWLALREPVDHRSVSADLRASVARHFASHAHVHLLDMGCGSGSNLRGLAPVLGASQHWTLVDWDEGLLAHARAALSQWADDAQEGETLTLRKAGKTIRVDFRKFDLAQDVERALDLAPDLVTAAAFFDLVSAQWIARFARAMTQRRLPLYTVLTYDGREVWSPPHEADAAMLAAFHQHQGSDKGFGPAAGPAAAQTLAAAFAAEGCDVRRASSPWRMAGGADGALMSELAKGAAQAVRETGAVASARIESWLASRLDASAPARACEIGHEDVFALPR
jgi:hypothetical protein